VFVPPIRTAAWNLRSSYNFTKYLRRNLGFKELELSWVGDYNPRMLAIYEALGATKAKTHITFRYMINPKLPFVRFKDERSDKQ